MLNFLRVFGLTWFRLAVPEQHGVHVYEEDHAAEVEVEIESLVERRRYVRGYYFRHGKGDPHNNQKFPVQRAQSGRQGVAASETEIEAERNAESRRARRIKSSLEEIDPSPAILWENILFLFSCQLYLPSIKQISIQNVLTRCFINLLVYKSMYTTFIGEKKLKSTASSGFNNVIYICT